MLVVLSRGYRADVGGGDGWLGGGGQGAWAVDDFTARGKCGGNNALMTMTTVPPYNTDNSYFLIAQSDPAMDITLTYTRSIVFIECT